MHAIPGVGLEVAWPGLTAGGANLDGPLHLFNPANPSPNLRLVLVLFFFFFFSSSSEIAFLPFENYIPDRSQLASAG